MNLFPSVDFFGGLALVLEHFQQLSMGLHQFLVRLALVGTGFGTGRTGRRLTGNAGARNDGRQTRSSAVETSAVG